MKDFLILFGYTNLVLAGDTLWGLSYVARNGYAPVPTWIGFVFFAGFGTALVLWNSPRSSED